MAEHRDGPVVIRSARTGRPPTRDRVYKAGELVRCEARIPARLAQQLYDTAHTTGNPLSVVIAELLAKALDGVDGAPWADPGSARLAENAKWVRELALPDPIASLQRTYASAG